jgi:DedD protein
MAQNTDTGTEDTHDADEALKKRLISRMAVAGVVVVALLGGLAVIDALYVPPPRKVAPEPVVEEQKAEEPKTAEAKPEEKAAEQPGEKPAEVAAGTEKKEEPKTETAKAEPPPPPAPAAEPERTASVAAPAPARPIRPLTLPATARPASIKPSEPVAAAQKPEPEKEIARTSPPAAVARHAPASRPVTQAAERSRQYVVQMGVFNNVANAEELHAKLQLAGIPSQIEARVQVGPFASRQEAEAAREKLHALGMETGILTAIKR